MFNFKQRALLVFPMDWKRRYTRNVEALALNILLRMNYSERRLNQVLLAAFAHDHLLEMDRGGGHIPRDQIDAWCSWNMRRRAHRT